jgi:putative transposase
MPQSLSKIYLHIVFSTKNREPFLSDEQLGSELHAFMGGISKQLDCNPIRIGGTADHVHLLVVLARTVSVADLVKEVKRVSSVWLHEKEISGFKWQAGYASFSVSQSNVEQVEKYISNQMEHHKKASFQDELRDFLKKHDLEFNEQYVWD